MVMANAQKAAAIELTNPIKAASFGAFVTAITDIIIQIGIPLAAVFIIWSGFLFVTARGDEKKLTAAKTTLVWTLIGTAIIVGAKVLATAIVNFAKGL